MNTKYKVKLIDEDNNLSETLNDKNILLLISVGQDYHEAEKLKSTITALNKLHPKKCMIMVADTLQKYNLYQSFDKDIAYDMAQALGDQWINRNRDILSLLNCPYQIFHWDYFITHPLYGDAFNQVMAAYQENEAFKLSILQTVHSFLARKKTPIVMKQSCLDYILEECPAIIKVTQSLGFNTIIYPKKMTVAMKSSQIIFSKHSSEKSTWLHLKFKKRNRKLILSQNIQERSLLENSQIRARSCSNTPEDHHHA